LQLLGLPQEGTLLDSANLTKVSNHCLDIGEVTGSGLGGIFFTLLSAFASVERERIASRISEVKQHRKAAGYYVGVFVDLGLM